MSDTPDTLIQLGSQARREGRTSDGRQSYSEAANLCRAAGDRKLLASSLVGLGELERGLKNRPAAIEHYREAESIYRNLPSPLRLAHTVRHIGDIFREDNCFDEARPCYEEALLIYCDYQGAAVLDFANAIRGLALLLGETGETQKALHLWQQARGLYDELNVPAGVQESEAQIALEKREPGPSGS